MKNKITIISFIIIIYSVMISSFIIKDKDISKLERRHLKQTETLKENLTQNLEEYLSDQFPLRDKLLGLNNYYNRNIIKNKEYNDAYLINDTIYEKEKPINKKSIVEFSTKINYIKNQFQNSQIYYTIIPDKSYFLNSKYLKLNYEEIYNNLTLEIPYINIIENLNINDYYKTDIHIKQPSYLKIIPIILEKYQITYEQETYEEKTYYPFYGASYSKVINTSPDTITYLTNEKLEKQIANHLEYGEKPIYDTNELEKIDSYNIFLNGPSSFIEIENNEAKTNKEIIIFRDSFASSLTPLLINYYKKITLIDLRYTTFDYIKDKINHNNQDILFIYSPLIINNSQILKVEVRK